MNEAIAIGVALLGIILGTWTCLYRIEKKVDRLFSLLSKTDKKDERPDHTDSVQSDFQHSSADATGRYTQKCVPDLRSEIPFQDKEQNQFNEVQH